MLSSYLKIALRSLARNKRYTVINILGLTVSIACVILIALYILDELTFDRFHKNSELIYRVIESKSDPQKGDEKIAAVSFNVSQGAVKNFPGVENSTIITSMGRTQIQNPSTKDAFYEEFLIAQPSLFQLFDFDLVAGDASTCLTEPNTIVLSKSLADKLFKEDNPIGKVIQTDRDLDFTVTGVMAPIPTNSHLQFEALFSFATLKTFDWYDRLVGNDWTSNNITTYLQLTTEADAPALEDKITAMVAEQQEDEASFNSSFFLQPLSKIHFYSHGFESNRNERLGNISYIYLLSIVGLFILLIACINYMNLATSRSSNYGKEVGVRKVIGANRKSLISRFFAETFLISLISFILAISVVNLLLPAFNNFTDKLLSLNIFSNFYLLLTLLGIVILVSLIAGFYPSLYLSRFSPALVLKGINRKDQFQFNLRRGLVVFQFVLSIVMIIGTGIAFSQMQFIQNKNLGFNEDQLVVVDINSGKVRAGFQTIKEGYARLAAVKEVCVSSRVPGEWKVMPQVAVNIPGNDNETNKITPYFIGADEAFLQTFEIELLKGRNFDRSRPADSAAVLLNLQAAKLLGVTEPGEQEFVIPTIYFDGTERELREPFRVNVIGIVNDFHFQSLYEKINPIILGYRNNPMHRIDYFTARISPENVQQTIADMTSILHSVDPGHLFEYHFLDQQLQQFYEADQRRSSIFTFAALLAIFIACLGLFGLSAFAAEQRTKEIGIRKVLGASIPNLIALLSKDFLKLVGIAMLIATPFAWYAGQKWLHNFAYSVDLNWWMFIVPGLLAVIIALLTVSFQSVKTALNNPVQSLRYE